MLSIVNTRIYGMTESIRGAKFPMAADVSRLDGELTDTINSLGRAGIGTGHDNFLNGIIVQFDLKCSNKMWVELQRYHFIDFVSSQSTMHRAARLDLESAFNEYVDDTIKRACLRLQEHFNEEPTPYKFLQLVYSLPAGLELTARMTTNYRQLKTIYHQRRDHVLPEWQMFCAWMEGLPNSQWIIGGDYAHAAAIRQQKRLRNRESQTGGNNQSV